MSFFIRIRNKLKRFVLLARGARVSKKATIYCKVEISHAARISVGEYSIIYKDCTLYVGKEGSFKLGKYSHIAPYGYFLVENQNIEIGDNVAIAPFCSFFCVSNGSKSSLLFREQYVKGDIRIGNNVFIGAQCVVLPGTVIGDNVVIAANSVVSGNLESGFLYGGSPAKKIKSIE